MRDRIHVMYDQTRIDLTTGDPQITTLVANDGITTETTPFSRCVETLIDPAVVTERLTADLSIDPQVSVPIFERIELDQL